MEWMTDSPLVAVAIGNGLAVWHTREEWEAFMRGLDREAIEAMTTDIDEQPRREAA
jgi:hypothetical protein